MMKHKRLYLATGLLMLAATTAGCGKGGLAGRLVSTRHEILVGRYVGPHFERAMGGLVADAQVQAYVQAVGQRVAGVAERRMPYEFHVLDCDRPNVFCLPGGRVYVTSGMMALLTRERELAALLANQVGHTRTRTPVRVLCDRLGGDLLVCISRLETEAEEDRGCPAANRLARELIRASYHSAEEIQADGLALRCLARAGYNPWGMPELLAHLHNRARTAPRDVAWIGSAHPMGIRRYKTAKVAVEVEYYYWRRHSPGPEVAGFDDVARRLGWYRENTGKEGLDPRLITFEPGGDIGADPSDGPGSQSGEVTASTAPAPASVETVSGR